MMTLREWMVRLVGTLRPSRRDVELEQELRLHVELVAEDARRRGSPSTDAVRVAAARLGGTTQALEALRDQLELPWLADGLRDIRHGVRVLARTPAFTLVAIVSLAIGIGANCAAFSFADALLLRPAAVPQPGRVVTVGATSATGISPMLVTSYPDYVDVRDRSTSFDGLVAFAEAAVAFEPAAGTPPKPAIGLVVSGNFFSVLGISPEVGRAFRRDEDQVPGRDAVIVLGHELWEQQFAADPQVLGRTVRLNGNEFAVIGVAPRGFTGFDVVTRYQFYVPMMMWPMITGDASRQPLEDRALRRLTIKGRLKPGATIEGARSELSVIARDLEREYPATGRNHGLAVRTELQNRVAQSPPAARLITLLGLLAAAVLCAACANVAGLLTSRAPMRAREMALRMAIGANRSRVLRLLVTESVLLALAGGLLGLGVGYGGILLFRQFRIPTDLPITAVFELDQRTLVVSLVVALVSAVLFGLVPAVRATRADLTAVMKATEAAGYGRRRTWGRWLLVGGQVAVSVVLLTVAAFVYRGFQQRFEAGPGFRTKNVLLMWFQPALVQYDRVETQRFFERLVESARLVPDLRSATLASYMPMDGGVGRVAIIPEGFQLPPGVETVAVPTSAVDEAYFEMLQVPVIRGRGFSQTDTADTPLVAVVNEQLAARYWPGQDALGKRFRVDTGNGPWAEIVGVARNTKYVSLIEAPMEFAYFSFRQRQQARMALFAESSGDPATLIAPLRQMVHDIDARQPIFNIRTFDEAYRMRAVVIFTIISRFVAAMGVMGLALALVGLYALVAYTVGRRTREIGIRLAIGARRSAVLRMILQQGMTVALVGLVLGLAASLGASTALAAFVPGGLQPGGGVDFVAFLLVGATVVAVTLLAALVPARRAARINPTDALRWE